MAQPEEPPDYAGKSLADISRIVQFVGSTTLCRQGLFDLLAKGHKLS
jgi:hypothetical protein